MDNNILNDNSMAGPAADYTASLGTMEHYNGLVFGDMTATQADCEGALAVGGTAKYGSAGNGYDIGGAGLPNTDSIMIGNYENPNDYPSLLLGGSVSGESTTANVYTGALVLRQGYQNEYEAGSFQFTTDSLRYEEDAQVEAFFTDARQSSLHTAEVLLNGSEKRISASELRAIKNLDHSQYRGDIQSDRSIQVYTLDCGEDEAITVGEIEFGSFVEEYDLVVVNLPARSVTFSGGAILYDGEIVNTSLPRIYEGNKLIVQLAAKVVFNLPNAEEVVLENYGITGTLLAPGAAVSGNGGSINGMLVADSLYQDGGMELHAFTAAMGAELFSLEVDGPYGQLTLHKTDESGALPLEDAVFSLYEYDPQTESSVWITDGTTDPDGALVFYDLAPGWYRIVETCSPPGYVREGSGEWIVELVLNNEGVVTQLETIYIKNQIAKGTAEFLKLDYDDGITKLNAETGEYELMQEGLTTGENGVLIIPDLPVGSYRLIETAAPAGYYLREGHPIDFAIEQDEHGDVKEFEAVDILNQKLASVQLIKQDAENPELLLPGAVFTLLRYDEQSGQYVELASGLTTDESGQLTVDGLEPGSYKFVETAAPSGYYLDAGAEVLFTIELDKEGWLVPLSPVIMANSALGKVRIVKVDDEDDTIWLEGAVFDLYLLNGSTGAYDLIRSDLTTGEDGSLLIEGLQPGDYKLVETQCPRGYIMPASPEVTFVITL